MPLFTSFFPQKVVYNNSGLFFLPLCMRLVNDESVNCRKLTAAAIKALIEKVSFVYIKLNTLFISLSVSIEIHAVKMSSKDHLLLIQCYYRKKPKLN
jgi:hypothetical protein